MLCGLPAKVLGRARPGYVKAYAENDAKHMTAHVFSPEGFSSVVVIRSIDCGSVPYSSSGMWAALA
jgi:hypothetical protein